LDWNQDPRKTPRKTRKIPKIINEFNCCKFHKISKYENFALTIKIKINFLIFFKLLLIFSWKMKENSIIGIIDKDGCYKEISF